MKTLQTHATSSAGNYEIQTETGAKYTACERVDGSCSVVVDGKTHEFVNRLAAQGAINLHSLGLGEYAEVVTFKGQSVVLNSSAVETAPDWAKSQANSLQLGDRDRIFYFCYRDNGNVWHEIPKATKAKCLAAFFTLVNLDLSRSN
jgi:hypothetical protein